jgi:hypothetical protein
MAKEMEISSHVIVRDYLELPDELLLQDAFSSYKEIFRSSEAIEKPILSIHSWL